MCSAGNDDTEGAQGRFPVAPTLDASHPAVQAFLNNDKHKGDGDGARL